MADPTELIRNLCGETKALVIVNEFASGNMQMPQICELFQAIATSDLERIGLFEMIRKVAQWREVSDEDLQLLLGGLEAHKNETTTMFRGPSERKTITQHKPFDEEVPPSLRETIQDNTPPPPPPPPQKGRGRRAPRQTHFIPKPGEEQSKQPVPPAPPGHARRQPVFAGTSNVSFSGLAEESARKRKILVADDDPRIRMIFRMKLEKNGYTVLEAQSGDQAWQKIENETPDAAVLDMKMPGMHGLELLAKLTSVGKTIPVCVCSAYDQLKEEMVIKHYPALRYFVKPVDPDALAEALRDMVPQE